MNKSVISWAVCIGLILLAWRPVAPVSDPDEPAPVQTPQAVQTAASEPPEVPEPSPTEENNRENRFIPEPVSLGIFRATAYCSCSTCCGRWAQDRPVDEDGNEIVYTAGGYVAQEGYTIAVDPEVIPLGTVVVIDGREYMAQDTGYGIEGRRIDIYHASHQAAREYAVQEHEVFLKE